MKKAPRTPRPRIHIMKRTMSLNMCIADTLDGKYLLFSTTIPKLCPEMHTILPLIIVNLSFHHMSLIDTISFLTADIKTIKGSFLLQKRAVSQVRIQSQREVKKR
jgi:hypothetical protein